MTVTDVLSRGTEVASKIDVGIEPLAKTVNGKSEARDAIHPNSCRKNFLSI